MMLAYYLITAAVTTIAFLLFICEYENRKTNYYYMALMMLMMVANAGYLAVALSTTLEEAILANKILYLGGCFVQPVTLLLICTLANCKLKPWMKYLNYGCSVLLYSMVLTIGYSDLYYEDVYLKTYKGTTVIGHTYGIGHDFFYIVIIGHTLLEVCLISYILIKKRSVSRKNLIGLVTIVVVNVYLFVVGALINSAIEIMPAAYAVNCIILLVLFRKGKTYNFEDILANHQTEEKNAYIMLDEKLNFLGCNQVAEQIFPQLLEAVVDKPLIQDRVGKTITDWVQRNYKHMEQSFEYETKSFHYECKVGRLYHKETHCGFLIEMRDDTDKWKYINLVSSHNEELEYEIKKQIQIAEELRIAKIEAESANEAKSQFLARMSHEIRTPINAVIGINEIVMRESKEEETKKYAHDIKTAANTLLGLINEILDSSKIDAGMMEILPAAYELCSFLNDLYNMVMVKAKGKNLTLNFQVDPEIPCELYGDDMRIKQVLINLLSNAVKYTQEGSVTLDLSYRTEGAYAILCYKVIDTGSGIKQEDFKKLFEKFERIEEKKNRNIEGTGLGLNIAYRLLKLMGSDLKVKSEYQKGSEFYFELKQKIVNIEPLGDFSERLELVAEQEQYVVSFVAPEAEILVVDDNEMNRTVFAGLLKNTQIKVFEASCGEECIKMLRDHTYHMVFLDHMMPNMDGIETFEIIKKEKLCEDTPVVMFTANAMTGEKEKYLQKGFCDFLAKPVVTEQLDEIILKYLPKDLIQECEMKQVIEEAFDLDKLPVLDEFDFGYAMRMLKSEDLLMQSLENFRDILKYVPEKLNGFLIDIEAEDSLSMYRIEVHALKSTSATVGALLLSKLARIIEVAAINADISKIMLLHPVLLEEIEKHRNRLDTLFVEEKAVIESYEMIESYLDMLDMSVSQEDYDTADFMMEEIKKYQYADAVQKLVDELTGQVLNMEAISAQETIKEIRMILSE